MIFDKTIDSMDRIAFWINHYFEELTGFGAGAGITTTVLTSVIVNSILNILLHALIIIASGILSSVTAHYTKKLLFSKRNKNGKN